jgi:uncharacterized oxidoreductase
MGLVTFESRKRNIMKISGNTILITGGGSGIGQGLAAALHKAGNTVIISGRRKAALEETVKPHAGMKFETLDVDSAEDISTFATRVSKTYPSLNVLINNAGIMRPEDVTAADNTTETAEAIVTTNLLGPIRLISAFLPHLHKQKAATIINVTSGLAFVPLAFTPTYSATKAALHSYTQSLRHQLRKSAIEILELAPPAVATELMPGQSKSPHSMPLADYISESMTILAGTPANGEILVERVKFLRNAEASGKHADVFNMLNPA